MAWRSSAPHVVDLVDHCEFDTIYHQHLCYSVTSLAHLFRGTICTSTMWQVPIHGGRCVYLSAYEDVQDSMGSFAEETRRKVDRIDYRDLLTGCDQGQFAQILGDLKHQGKRTWAGAAAKATTLMSYVFDRRQLDYVVDLNQFKQGRLWPATGC
jgi:hypothetical protein